MLWLEVLQGSSCAGPFTCRVATDSPYVFSVYIDEEARVGGGHGNSYDFLIEGEDTKHYLQLGLRSGRIQSIDGMVIAQEQCTVYDSRYTHLGVTQEDAPLFAPVPLAQDREVRLSGSTISQRTKVSLCVYLDAVLFSFDRFYGDVRIPLAHELDVLVSTSGLLAGLLFCGRTADEVRALAVVPSTRPTHDS